MPTPADKQQTRELTLKRFLEAGAAHVYKREAEVVSFDKEARTVELAFSSELEVRRDFGIEILDHSAGSCDLSRLNNRAAVLVNHDPDQHVGVVESARIDIDRRGRSLVRFGKGEQADEVFNDVVDGIRPHVSVGYSIRGLKFVEERDGIDVWCVTAWEPHEISIVAIPADPSVGVGRSADLQVAPEVPPAAIPAAPQASADTNETAAPEAPADENEKPVATQGTEPTLPATARSKYVNEDEIRAAAEAAIHQRNARMLEIAEKFGASELGRQFVGNPTATVEDLQRAILEQGATRSKPVSQSPEVGLTDKEAGQYSMVKAIRAMANPGDRKSQEEAAFEREVSGALAKRTGKNFTGYGVPLEVMARAALPGYNLGGDGSTGNNLKATILMAGSFIDMLYNSCIMVQAATPLTGLVGDIDIPKKLSKGQGYWVDEDEAVGEALATFGKVSMAPRGVGAFSRITRKMLLQSTPAIEQLVRADIAQSLGQTIDSAALYGDGVKKPVGIFNTPGIHQVAFAGVTPTYAEVVEMETEVAAANAALGTLRYVANARMRGALKVTQMFPGTANGVPVWQGNSMNGYDASMTNQVATGDLLFGNLNDALIGFWGGLDLTVDTVTLAKQGAHQIIALQDLDFIVRHPQSFTVGRKAA